VILSDSGQTIEKTTGTKKIYLIIARLFVNDLQSSLASQRRRCKRPVWGYAGQEA
jgi:hypothetical protein